MAPSGLAQRWAVTIAMAVLAILAILGGFFFKEGSETRLLAHMIGAILVVLDVHYFVLGTSVDERVRAIGETFQKEMTETHNRIDQIESGWSGYQFTPTSQDNWGKAIDMASRVQKRSIVYDVSSHRNIDEFDRLMVQKAKEGATIYRLVCFDATDPIQEETKKWFLAMIDEDRDGDDRYGPIRERMEEGSVFVYHLPQTSFSDFLVCDYEGDGSNVEAVIGFRTSFQLTPRGHETYTSGLYIRNRSCANAFKEFCRGFLTELAKKHLREEHRARENHFERVAGEPLTSCLCVSYFDEVNQDRLRPDMGEGMVGPRGEA